MTDCQGRIVMGLGSEETTVIFIDCWGTEPRPIEVAGKIIWFTWSDRFGPRPCTQDDKELDLGPRHPFWRAASLWNLQGKRVETETGRAIWHEPKKPVTAHMGGRHYRVVEPGEPGWDW